MPNSDHLSELNKGVESWNQWRRENPSIAPNLRKADLSGVDLGKANLSRADLRKANLSRANLSFADLREANLTGATFSRTCFLSANLSMADLTSANLNKIDLSFAIFHRSNLRSANLSKTVLKSAIFTHSQLSEANLSEANLSEANLRKACLRKTNLSKAILSKANLSFTDLSGANLSQANLNLAVMQEANLQYADLSAVQALRTNFKGSYLTGACLQYWNTNSQTNLNNVQCDYVYQKKSYGLGFSSRYPSDKTFQPGEFSNLFQKVSETIDSSFFAGITECIKFFREQQQYYPYKMFDIQEIILQSDRGLFVSFKDLPEANEETAKKFNEEQLKLLEANYEIQTKTLLLELSQKHNAVITEILAKAVGTPSINQVNVKATGMSNSEEFTNNFQNPNIANFANKIGDNARQQANQYNYATENKSLADAAKEIQLLLDQLSQHYPTDTTPAKYAIANEAIQRIDGDPSFTERLLSALSAGSTSALEQFLNHPAASFFISALEDWKKTRLK